MPTSMNHQAIQTLLLQINIHQHYQMNSSDILAFDGGGTAISMAYQPMNWRLIYACYLLTNVS